MFKPTNADDENSLILKDMKTLLGFIAAAALFAATGTSEISETPILQFLWTCGCIAVFYATCKIYEKKFMTKEDRKERV